MFLHEVADRRRGFAASWARPACVALVRTVLVRRWSDQLSSDRREGVRWTGDGRFLFCGSHSGGRGLRSIGTGRSEPSQCDAILRFAFPVAQPLLCLRNTPSRRSNFASRQGSRSHRPQCKASSGFRRTPTIASSESSSAVRRTLEAANTQLDGEGAA